MTNGLSGLITGLSTTKSWLQEGHKLKCILGLDPPIVKPTFAYLRGKLSFISLSNFTLSELNEDDFPTNLD